MRRTLSYDEFKMLQRKLLDAVPADQLLAGERLCDKKQVQRRMSLQPDTIAGDVLDRRIYLCKLNVGIPQASECECDEQGLYCRHMVALFCWAARESNYKLQSFGELVVPQLPPPGAPEPWTERLAADMRKFALQSHQLAAGRYDDFRSSVLLPLMERLPETVQSSLETIAVVLFMAEAERPYHRDYAVFEQHLQEDIRRFRADMTEKLRAACRRVDGNAVCEADRDGFVAAMLGRLHGTVFGSQLAFGLAAHVLEAYRYVWWHAFHAPAWVEEERRRLEQRRGQGRNSADITLGLLHQAFLGGNAESAMSVLRTLEPAAWPRALTPYFQLFADEAPQQLLEWLRLLRPVVLEQFAAKRASSQLVHWYSLQWLAWSESAVSRQPDVQDPPEATDAGAAGAAGMEAAGAKATGEAGMEAAGAKATGEAGMEAAGAKAMGTAGAGAKSAAVPEALEAIGELFPVSANIFEQLLVQLEDWDRWVDLHLYFRSDPQRLDKELLRTVESRHPEALLRLYHIAVEQWIAVRNRDGYRMAARLLSKLQKLYKRVKRTGEWDEFLERLSDKYSRLRALQEELRKKKLIS